MKALLITAILSLAVTAQDAVTITIKAGDTTRTVTLSGEAAAPIIQAAEHTVKQSPALFKNSIDVLLHNLAASAIATLLYMPGAKLADLLIAQKAAQRALDDEVARVQEVIRSQVVETQAAKP